MKRLSKMYINESGHLMACGGHRFVYDKGLENELEYIVDMELCARLLSSVCVAKGLNFVQKALQDVFHSSTLKLFAEKLTHESLSDTISFFPSTELKYK